MKKIIELVEKALDTMQLPGFEITQEMNDAFAEVSNALAERRQLEQTPITEEWLKEHGWEKKEMYWIWVYPHDKKMWLEWYPYEERLSRYVHCVDEWDNHSEKDELTDRMHCFNLAALYDALELCNIKID